MLTVRKNESELFEQLQQLCSSPGYLHAIAYFCYRDNLLRYKGELTTDDVLKQFGHDRLLRTEISTLIGLCCKSDLDEGLQSHDVIKIYIDKTEELLSDLHQAMMPPLEEIFDPSKIKDPNFNPFNKGAVLRESIFYGGESAFNFQYKDFSGFKYKNDSEWLKNNKGYDVCQAVSILDGIQHLQNTKFTLFGGDLSVSDFSEFNLLDLFKVNSSELSEITDIPENIVINFLESFSTPMDMDSFQSLDDFNPKNAYPIIKSSDNEYLILQIYSLLEAFYETPFFWFYNDKEYRDVAMINRGQFTEIFSAQRLAKVFGDDNVFQNIDIYDSSNNKAGEIDVLVVFSNRAIVLQAKSKKLTIASRKGNDLCLRDDFKKAVQDAYDQAYTCSDLLTNTEYRLFNESGEELTINRNYDEIYPFCVVSDNYPALSFQARQFLDFHTTDIIKPPFVMDVFFLDVATEMLESPLYFLSYISRRTSYIDKLNSAHELTILSFHLKQNLWVDSKFNMVCLSDDICADLDLSMLVRRMGIPGPRTPNGILTKFKNTNVGRLIEQIERLEESATIDLGFLILHLSEPAMNQISQAIEHTCGLATRDGNNHDFTLCIQDSSTGLTIHTNFDSRESALSRLKAHSEQRKYTNKAGQWFGICLDPTSKELRFGISLEYPWVKSSSMDELVKSLPKASSKHGFINQIYGRKVGRNEQCPCGSGVKFKKCCLV